METKGRLKVIIANVKNILQCITIRKIAMESPEAGRMAGSKEEESRWTNDQWKEFFFGSGTITVLAIDEKTSQSVGIGMATPRKKQKDYFIRGVYVVPEFRGKIVFSMFNKGKEEIAKIKGPNTLRIATGNKNKIVRKISERFGFKKVSKVKQFLLTDKGHRKYIIGCLMMEFKL